MRLIQGDCLHVMDQLISEGMKVDAIITDPPYGMTACKWDSVIPFDDMWPRLKALRKERAPVVLFGSEPFSSALRMSNIKEFKYDWIWEKDQGSNFFMAKKQPMKNIEMMSVFYNNQCMYNPQMAKAEKSWEKKDSGKNVIGHLGVTEKKQSRKSLGAYRYPLVIQKFTRIRNGLHPTQKPVALMEYLIKTYTNEGDTVLDFTMGSGSTGVACKNLNRNFIGIELDKKYFDIAKDRIENTAVQTELKL